MFDKNGDRRCIKDDYLPSVSLWFVRPHAEGEAGVQTDGSTIGEEFVITVGYGVSEDAADGHIIAMDSAHGVFRLACLDALLSALMTSLSWAINDN